jgi:AdoMet-dependent heme synthase
LPFEDKPILVFWETTRSCLLSCLHCRASAITKPLPGELTGEEGEQLIDQVTGFGEPYPTIIFTGGDPLQRHDLFELMDYAARRRIGFAVSPAVTELLSHEALLRIKKAGASSISISLDGACNETHDMIRRKPGTFDKTIDTIKDALKLGINVQVNTAIMKQNLLEIPRIFSLIRRLGVKTWELFFLIRVGRGAELEDLTPSECESVCRFLVLASRYGMVIRTVEAPFIRRVARQMTEREEGWDDALFDRLRRTLGELEGGPSSPSTIRARGTLDGDGIIFVAHDGSIYPGGLTPFQLGNVKTDKLVDVYRDSPVLRRIRSRKFDGRCCACEYREVCGGSRARAYSYYGDLLASDVACLDSDTGIQAVSRGQLQ